MRGLTQTLPNSPFCPFNIDHAEETRYLYHCTRKSTKRDPCLPTQVSHITTTAFFFPPWQNGNIHLHTPSSWSKPVQPPHNSTQGRNLPPPCLGPVLIRKWEQQPGTGVIPACHFPPLRYFLSEDTATKYPQQIPCPQCHKIPGDCFLQSSQIQAGGGELSQEEKRGRS